jgi:hypothetical protein
MFGYEASAREAGGAPPKGILKNTCWRYVDFMRLYRGLRQPFAGQRPARRLQAIPGLVQRTARAFPGGLSEVSSQVQRPARARVSRVYTRSVHE